MSGSRLAHLNLFQPACIKLCQEQLEAQAAPASTNLLPTLELAEVLQASQGEPWEHKVHTDMSSAT